MVGLSGCRSGRTSVAQLGDTFGQREREYLAWAHQQTEKARDAWPKSLDVVLQQPETEPDYAFENL